MTEKFVNTQKQFVNAVREPDKYIGASEDERRRMGIYQSLFFNNINNFLKSGFPVLRSIVSDEVWHRVVRRFFVEHRCRSPYFAEISKEFVEYLSVEPVCIDWLPSFASELAHYEWLELDVSIRRSPLSQSSRKSDGISMSPFATLVSYAYPVHLIGEEYQPDAPTKERNYYVIYRQQDYSVQFLHINAMTALLLQYVENAREPVTKEQLLEQLSDTAPHIELSALREGVNDTVQKMSEKGILQCG